MTNTVGKSIIDEYTIEHVGVLAQLELTPDEKRQAREDMAAMVAYVEKLKELNTDGVEPLAHLFPVGNVFREDEVTTFDGRQQMLEGAPQCRDNLYVVPRTIDET